MRRTAVGLTLVVALVAIVVYSAVHHAILGVVLAAPPALLFLLALIDNRFVYARRQMHAEETPAPAPTNDVPR